MQNWALDGINLRCPIVGSMCSKSLHFNWWPSRAEIPGQNETGDLLSLPMDCRIPGQHHILSYIINYYHIYIYMYHHVSKCHVSKCNTRHLVCFSCSKLTSGELLPGMKDVTKIHLHKEEHWDGQQKGSCMEIPQRKHRSELFLFFPIFQWVNQLFLWPCY